MTKYQWSYEGYLGNFVVASEKRPVNSPRKAIFKRIGCSCLFFMVFIGVANITVFLLFFPPRLVKDIVQRPIYETVWKAEDWFDDPEVLKLCHAIERQDVEAMDHLI